MKTSTSAIRCRVCPETSASSHGASKTRFLVISSTIARQSENSYRIYINEPSGIKTHVVEKEKLIDLLFVNNDWLISELAVMAFRAEKAEKLVVDLIV